jgi:hypothetical protein
MRRIAILFLFGLMLICSTAYTSANSKLDPAPEDRDPDLTVSNGIYRLYLADASPGCGSWTAGTEILHPAGAGQAILYGGDDAFARSNFTTLRSYSSGTDYHTSQLFQSCGMQICGVAGLPTVHLIDEVDRIGYRFAWSFQDGAGPTIEFVQEVVVEGPRDGTETVDNTVIRETHIVRNLGPGNFVFGLRKMWDLMIGILNPWDGDDGPLLGDCETPDAACDRSMNLTADGSFDGFYPRSYIVNEDPSEAVCPPGVDPYGYGCGGAPRYIVAATVTGPSLLEPPPDGPELLQFNNWWLYFYVSCWQPHLIDAALCEDPYSSYNDSVVAYFYGLSEDTAEILAAGEERSFTQYIVSHEASCPDIISFMEVDIDIKPGSYPNSINPRSHGVVAVALLGNAGFDVLDADVATLKFGPAEAMPAHDLADYSIYSEHLQDVNCDGYMDLVSHYGTQETGIVCGDTSATLTGNTFSGLLFEGSDSIRTVGCRSGRTARPFLDRQRESSPSADAHPVDLTGRE